MDRFCVTGSRSSQDGRGGSHSIDLSAFLGSDEEERAELHPASAEGAYPLRPPIPSTLTSIATAQTPEYNREEKKFHYGWIRNRGRVTGFGIHLKGGVMSGGSSPL